MMGGLNYQIEHHLFPSMARPHLRRAAPMIAAYCREHGVPYTQTGLWQSYAIVLRYINRVGSASAIRSCARSSSSGRASERMPRAEVRHVG